MRANSKTSLADALFGKTKKAVISVLFSHPDKSWHLRELARFANVSPTMLGKEVDVLAAAGIVLDERDGNRRRLRSNPDSPIFVELQGIARKTAGLADIVKNALLGVPGIEVAFIFGSVARGEERPGSDVDVCLIGSAAHRAVASALSAIEPAVGRPVNPIVYTRAEFHDKVSGKSPFVSKMLASKKIFLIGGEHEFERAVG